MKKKKRPYRFLRRTVRVLGGLLLLVLASILCIRSPWGQRVIVSEFTDYISDKTQTVIQIDKLFITFTGSLSMEGLYVEDTKGDTLLYSKSVAADLAWAPLVFDTKLDLKSLTWNGLTANIRRGENAEHFNFDFILQALLPEDTAPTSPSEAPLEVTLGVLHFSEFNLSYTDAFLGIESRLQLGELQLKAHRTDLAQLRFEFDQLTLSGTEVFYKQTKPLAASDSAVTPLPYLIINTLEISDSKVSYTSVPDGMAADVTIGSFLLELPQLDLNTNTIDIDLLTLENSSLSLQVPESTTEDMAATSDSGPVSFEWPEVSVRGHDLTIANTSVNYRLGNSPAIKGNFNPNDVGLSAITLQASAFDYRSKQLQFALERLSFRDKSGFRLNNLGFKTNLEDTKASITALNIETNYSVLEGALKAQFPSITELINSPEKTKINIAFPQLKLALNELLFFQPDLKKNPYFEKVAASPITGNLAAEGGLNALRIGDMQLHWRNTELSAEGDLRQLTQLDSLSYDFTSLEATTVRKDILTFVSETELGISLPQTVFVSAKAKGNLNSSSTDLLVKIPEGTVTLSGNYDTQDALRFDADLQVDSLQLNALLANEQLGKISFTMALSGAGESFKTLNAKMTSDFSQLQFKNYDFSNLNLKGNMSNGIGAIQLDFKDQNLNLRSTTHMVLDSSSTKINLDLNLIGADLYALGMTREQMKTGFLMTADFEGNPSDFELEARSSEGIVVYENEQYQLSDIALTSHIDTVHTEITIDSDLISGFLASNASPQGITTALTQQFENYFKDPGNSATATDSVAVKMRLNVKPSPILTDVFFEGIERLDPIVLAADFNSSTRELQAKLQLPFAEYHGSTLDSLDVDISGDGTDLRFTAGLASLNADPIAMNKTYFEGQLRNKQLALDFASFDKAEKVAHIASVLRFAKDTTQLHIDPSNLILNRKQWSVPEENQIVMANGFLAFEDMRFVRNAQALRISTTPSDSEAAHIGIAFDNFKVQTFLSLLNPDEKLASGAVNGDLILENPFDAPGLLADFTISALEVMGKPLGELSLKAAAQENATYDFDLALKDAGADVDLKGTYTAANTGAELRMNLDLNRIDLSLIEAFTEGAIKDSKGSLSGQIALSGTSTAPEYTGALRFNDARFTIASLNSIFEISEETLQLDTKGIYMNNLQIADGDGSTFTLNGSISTQDVLNPSFDLKLDTKQFNILNSTKEDNNLFYGTANIDADLSIKGDLQLPIVEGKLRIGNATKVTYVIPESQLDVEERDGVVIFVNQKNPNAILTRNDQEETPNFFRGMNVNTSLTVAEDAEFHIIIDERSGDNLRVAGNAALRLNIAPNGITQLSGRYELKSGHYETNLYNLVKRRFEINPGSTIVWQGDPTDAKLDLTAVYEVETSAAPLMSSVTSGQDNSITNKYRQVLPFLVYLNVDGELLTPELSFGLDIPENEQGALGGAVYSRVQQLNQQESELNKQVFSLLALNRFYPDSGSDGSSGGTAAIARDNVNRLLSGELNAFSDKVFGKSGFELDFDLDSFTDYQGDGPQDRTQLNINAQKKLFNDRLIVTAGSAVDVEGSAQPGQEETPIIGNVSLEYLLTKDGRYRLSGFRKNEYENIIDGQLVVTGVALIFNWEFNKFSQLFNPLGEAEKKDNIKKETHK